MNLTFLGSSLYIFAYYFIILDGLALLNNMPQEHLDFIKFHSLVLVPICLISGIVPPLLGLSAPYSLIIMYKYNKYMYGKGFTIRGYEVLFYMVSLIMCGATMSTSSGYLFLNY
jgi:hypothetical protein